MYFISAQTQTDTSSVRTISYYPLKSFSFSYVKCFVYIVQTPDEARQHHQSQSEVKQCISDST